MACRFSSGLVMSILVIFLAVECCFSAKFDQGNLGTEVEKDVFLQSENKFLLGRKLLQEIHGKPAHFPGKSRPADSDNSLTEVQKLKNSQESKPDVAKRDPSKTKDESSAFLEAADEVANLMRRDYRGMARRKPPINNHEPND